jgi:hypothetical protein
VAAFQRHEQQQQQARGTSVHLRLPIVARVADPGGRLVAGIPSSNPVGSMDVCMLSCSV